jgi:hypothetical protein
VRNGLERVYYIPILSPPKSPLNFFRDYVFLLLPIKLLTVPILINEFSESYLIHCVTNNWKKADDES